MKQKVLLLMVLALGICSINVSAQTKKSSSVKKTTVLPKNSQTKSVPVTRELKIEQDGFEWYLVKKGGKVGAESKDGKKLIPIEMGNIDYQYNSQSAGPGFWVTKSGDKAYYSPDGECVIPFSRHYHIINKERDTSVGTYYWGWATKGGPLFFCNADGEEVCQIDGYSLAEPHFKNGKFFWKVCLNTHDEDNWCIMDGNGNIVFGPVEAVFISDNFNGKQRGKWISKDFTVVSTTSNPFAKTQRKGIRYNSDNKNNNSASISNSSSNSNPGNNTTTIHVEHHRNPVPVQEWQQCNICYGSGNCGICGGNGWNPYSYANGRYVRCISCGGNGRCSYCAGRGGKNITVYR